MDEQIIIEGETAKLSINPKIYTLESIYSASYVFLDKAYVLLNGDPKKEIIIKLKSKKEKEDLKKLGLEFFNELINYSDYEKRAEKTKQIREIILQRALISNDPSLINTAENNEDEEDFEKLLKELDSEEEDTDELIVPWE